MAAPVNPTKANLMALQKSLTLAQNGYDLLDRKRNILMRETMVFLDSAKTIGAEIEKTFAEAYEALRLANVTLGVCDELAEAVPIDHDLTLRSRSVMGVEIPMVHLPPDEAENCYGYASSNAYLDEAFFLFRKAKMLSVELAQIESSVYRLATAISKTAKRANALKNIVIPKYETQIAHINGVLEEKELEEHTRLKMIKEQKR